MKRGSLAGSIVLVGALGLFAGVGFFRQSQETVRLRAELERARFATGELERARAENQQLRAKRVSEAELAALRADHAALPRLRAELETLNRGAAAVGR